MLLLRIKALSLEPKTTIMSNLKKVGTKFGHVLTLKSRQSFFIPTTTYVSGGTIYLHRSFAQ